MGKSPDAFRTISEVADWLGIQAHVLRFWESKFTQVKPVKRAGGRRYYRPADMLLLGGIKKLLHDDGLTIKGVQKILREEGMSHVSDMSGPLDEATSAQIEEKPVVAAPLPVPDAAPEEKGVVLSFEAPAVEDLADDVPTTAPEGPTPASLDDMMQETPAAAAEELPQAVDAEPSPIDATDAQEPSLVQADEVSPAEDVQPQAAAPVAEPVETKPEPEEDIAPADLDTPVREDAPVTDPETSLPAFLRRPLDPETAPAATDNASAEPDPVEEITPTPEPIAAKTPAPDAPKSTPKPRIIDIAPFTPEAEFNVSQSVLTSAYRLRRSSPKAAAQIRPLLARLTTLRDGMSARRGGGEAASPKD